MFCLLRMSRTSSSGARKHPPLPLVSLISTDLSSILSSWIDIVGQVSVETFSNSRRGLLMTSSISPSRLSSSPARAAVRLESPAGEKCASSARAGLSTRLRGANTGEVRLCCCRSTCSGRVSTPPLSPCLLPSTHP